ncbi:putative transcriptional regulator [Deinococcus aerius]|uniref:Putative transcriptional regulator n=1 Tax=Deinococcus aerius TaxID=200253 RepID=A0A2I9DM38_9DEIO|nr:helix-turn-helix transcriptional regulator [Deinococcus aerius]GBF06061.1 putative transcriptional regulator [Deinococcus aerius]
MGKFRMSLTILRILELMYADLDREHYGLELGRAANLSNGALYPALDRLDRAGYLTSALEEIDEKAEGRRKRRYYKLSAAGIRLAEQELRGAPRLPGRGAARLSSGRG